MDEQLPRVSETEVTMQDLYAQLLRIKDPEERARIQAEIKALRESPEGQRDQARHNRWAQESTKQANRK
jgi:hypothetical protein